jgi:exopolysaccharide biosynthesis polyprenyl glycosylphosphotransferase
VTAVNKAGQWGLGGQVKAQANGRAAATSKHAAPRVPRQIRRTAAPSPALTVVPDAAPSGRGRGHRQPAPLEHLTVLLADVVLLAAMLLVAPVVVALAGVLTAMAAWSLKGLYRRRIGLSVLDDLPALGAGAGVGLLAAVLTGLPAGWTTTGNVLAAGGVLTVGAFLSRAVSYELVRRLRRSGRTAHTTMIIGSGSVAQLAATRMAEHPESGLSLVGALSVDGHALADGLPHLGEPDDLVRVVTEHEIDDVVVGYGALPTRELVDLLRACDRLDVEIFVIPRLFEMHRLSQDDDCLWDIPLRRVRRSPYRVMTWRVKRLFDVVASAVALVALSPILLATALAVRLELGPGVIFRQTRIGVDGRSFSLLKFRSMRPAPPGEETSWTVTGGDRVGRVGAFIRRYSIDELPQLINVLRGDMSVVGPRPERPEYVAQFSESVPRYHHRHRVPVGLTGLAAVKGLRGDTSIVDRAQFDNWYIENWSLWFDMKIIARTALAVVRATGS